MDNKYYTQKVDDEVKTIPQQEIMNHYTTFHKKKSTNARYKNSNQNWDKSCPWETLQKRIVRIHDMIFIFFFSKSCFVRPPEQKLKKTCFWKGTCT